MTYGNLQTIQQEDLQQEQCRILCNNNSTLPGPFLGLHLSIKTTTTDDVT